MDSLGMNHIHSSLCNYGLGRNFGTPKTAASNRTYNNPTPTVRFGAQAAECSHQVDFAIINSTNPFSANTNNNKPEGWSPFSGKSHTLNLIG